MRDVVCPKCGGSLVEDTPVGYLRHVEGTPRRQLTYYCYACNTLFDGTDEEREACRREAERHEPIIRPARSALAEARAIVDPTGEIAERRREPRNPFLGLPAAELARIAKLMRHETGA